RARRSTFSPLTRRGRWLVARRVVRASAFSRRAAAAVRALAGGGRAHGRGGTGMCVRLEARRAASPRLSRAGGTRRDVVAARAGATRCGDRLSGVAPTTRAGVAPDRIRALGDRTA